MFEVRGKRVKRKRKWGKLFSGCPDGSVVDSDLCGYALILYANCQILVEESKIAPKNL